MSQVTECRASTVTGIVDRVVRVRLTPRGREVARRTPSMATDLLRGAIEALPVDDRRQLLAIFAKLERALAKRVESLGSP